MKILSREEKALYKINKDGIGLEIGPSHNPLAPKKNGYKVHILDHASTEELKEKYKTHGVNLENIEEVDFVWKGQPLPELIGKTACYDWIIASHVIEHVPDFISFLQQVEMLLTENGVLSLVIPDRRYCFDYFNFPTSTGAVLDAWNEKRTRPSPGNVFDHIANASKRAGNIAWGASSKGEISMVHTLGDAVNGWRQARDTQDYIDVHCWRFTPASFRLIVEDLQVLGLVNLGINAEFETEGCEFFFTLSRQSAPKNTDRLNNLEQQKLENTK